MTKKQSNFIQYNHTKDYVDALGELNAACNRTAEVKALLERAVLAAAKGDYGPYEELAGGTVKESFDSAMAFALAVLQLIPTKRMAEKMKEAAQ